LVGVGRAEVRKDLTAGYESLERLDVLPGKPALVDEVVEGVVVVRARHPIEPARAHERRQREHTRPAVWRARGPARSSRSSVRAGDHGMRPGATELPPRGECR